MEQRKYPTRNLPNAKNELTLQVLWSQVTAVSISCFLFVAMLVCMIRSFCQYRYLGQCAAIWALCCLEIKDLAETKDLA